MIEDSVGAGLALAGRFLRGMATSMSHRVARPSRFCLYKRHISLGFNTFFSITLKPTLLPLLLLPSHFTNTLKMSKTISFGRGGFGNRTLSPKITAKDVPDSPELEACLRVPSTPAPIQHFTSPSQTFRTGRGGYGNNLPISKMNTMTPAEYLQEVDRAASEPKRYTIGRGGSGNTIVHKEDKKASTAAPANKAN